MSRRIPVTIGDTSANLDVVVLDRATKQPVSLITAVSVALRFRAEGTTTLLNSLTGTLLAGKVLNNGVVDTTSAVVGAFGRVRFDLVPALGNAAGYYEGEVAITHSGGLVQTLDERIKFTLREAI